MSWLRSQLAGAGLASLGLVRPLIFLGVASALAGFWVAASFKVWALGVCAGLAVAGVCLEALVARAKSRSNVVARHWPEVIEVLVSGLQSSTRLDESFRELADRGPAALRPMFADISARLDAGQPLDAELARLKTVAAERHADSTVELLRLSSKSGGQGLIPALRIQAQQARTDLALLNELQSKQGWVVGTAKLGLVSPWVIVAMLSLRPENAVVYNSAAGAAILGIGLLISIGAYRLIHYLAALPEQPRVLS